MHSNIEAVKRYYSDTQFEYTLLWNWRLNTIPALHFGFYDTKATNHRQAIIRANEVLAEFGSIQKGSKIIDAGCGLGHSSEWLAKTYDATVTGITIVPKQLKTIEKRLANQPVKSLNFLLANYLQMPFPDNSLDVVWAVESVCHAMDKLLFYKEAFRVLKPGGRLLMADYNRNIRPMEEEKEALLKEIFHAWAVPDLDTLEEHRNNSECAGFSFFTWNDVTSNVMTSYRNLRKTCRRYRVLSKLLKRLGVISLIRYNNMLGSSKMADAIEQGVFRYHHILAVK